MENSFVYNDTTNSWKAELDFNVGVSCPSTCKLQNGNAFAVGGAITESPFYCSKQCFVVTTDGSLLRGPDGFFGRQHHGVVEVAPNVVLVTGGIGDGVSYLSSTELVDLNANTCQRGPEMHVPHAFSQLVAIPYKGRQALVVISGLNQSANTPLIEVIKPECTSQYLVGVSEFAFRGSAKTDANRIFLTDSSLYQAGAAWVKNKVRVASGFDIRFGFTFIKGDDHAQKDGGPEGADGVALVIQNVASTLLGESGRGIGYDMIKHGLAVEFDSYNNAAFLDPSGSHVAIHIGDGSNLRALHKSLYLLAMASEGIPILRADGTKYHARVKYDGTNVSVWLGTNPNTLNAAVSAPVNIATDLSLGADGSAWVGVTSATGFSSEMHTLDYFTIEGCDALVVSVNEPLSREKELEVYPSPAGDQVTLQFDAALPPGALIVIVDVLGNEVGTHQAPADVSSMQLSLRDLPSGTYFVRIAYGGELIQQGRIQISR
jgi:hypothetical protein